jgi:fatty acid desaturase
MTGHAPASDPDADPREQGGAFGIFLLVVLWVVYAALPIMYLLGVPRIEASGIVRLVDPQGSEPIANAVLAAVAIVTAAGLLLGRSWGYMLAMLTVGIGLVADIYLYVRGDPAYVHMALAVTITFYLNQASVRRRFRASSPPPAGALEHP